DRIARLGSETLVELLDASGNRFVARLDRADSERLGLARGERVEASAPRDPATADFVDDYSI
ncbi:MAG: TOBE domain-containing protein, partial [Propionicimonas sp.]